MIQDLLIRKIYIYIKHYNKNNMFKKAQITIFIIIGVCLLIFAGIMLYYNITSKEAESEEGLIEPDISPVQSFIDSCLKITLEQGIDYISLRGGYYHAPDDYIIHLGYKIPYYHDVVKGDLMISLQDIEDQISYYIEDNLGACINNFSVFKNIGYTIESDNLNIISTIHESGVNVDLTYPLTIQLGDTVRELDSFTAYVETPLHDMYWNVRKYIDKQMTVPNAEPLDSLILLADEYDFKFENIFRNDSHIYALNTNHTAEDGFYVFVFAVKYDWSSLGV